MRHIANYAIAAALGILLAAQAALAGPSSTSVTYGPASATRPGIVTTGAQTLAGNKTLTGTTTLGVTNIADSGYLIWGEDTSLGAPTFNSRSAGARLSLNRWLGGGSVDYGLGVDTNTMWYAIAAATDNRFHRWYGGTTSIMSLGGGGILDVSGGPAPAIKTAGDISTTVAGKGLLIKEGTNAKMGRSTLVAGTVVVANTSVTAASEIFLTSNVDGGDPGFVRVVARTAGTSFTITSSSGTDTSTVSWLIMEPAP